MLTDWCTKTWATSVSLVTKQCLGAYISFVTDVHLSVVADPPMHLNRVGTRMFRQGCHRQAQGTTHRTTYEANTAFLSCRCNPNAHKLVHQAPEHWQHPSCCTLACRKLFAVWGSCGVVLKCTRVIKSPTVAVGKFYPMHGVIKNTSSCRGEISPKYPGVIKNPTIAVGKYYTRF